MTNERRDSLRRPQRPLLSGGGINKSDASRTKARPAVGPRTVAKSRLEEPRGLLTALPALMEMQADRLSIVIR